MKIIYKQSEDLAGSLRRFGISNCYFKKVVLSRDQTAATKKQHQHTGFELHIITTGCQVYVVDGEQCRVEAGSFLLVCPQTPHQMASSAPNTQKFAITFQLPTAQGLNCFSASLTEQIAAAIERICQESQLQKDISATLIENAVLEILVWVLRQAGIKEKQSTSHPEEEVEISFAKQYIDDNIARNPSVSDVAAFCYISSKQLTRIFQRVEGISPGGYITRRRVKQIENLLAEGKLSLRQISENMHFNSEHYFNAFFKKHAGMTPGAYRKMQGK